MLLRTLNHVIIDNEAATILLLLFLFSITIPYACNASGLLRSLHTELFLILNSICNVQILSSGEE